MKEYSENRIFDYLLIFAGTLFMSLALNIFFEPNNMVVGGATGIAVIIKHMTANIIDGGVSLGISNLIINLPLFYIAVKMFGRKFLRKTVIATVMLSVNLEITSFAAPFHGDFVIISVYGGALSGLGLALIFRARASTGGSDLAASLIQQKFHQFTVAFIMLIIDVIIILCGFFIFGFMATMYAAISVFITSKVIDAILEGLSFAKATFIISDMSEEICGAVFKELDRGVTALYGKGMFTKENKNVLLCVVSKKEVFKLKELAKRIDENAFIMVADVREVLGNGF